MRARRFSFGAFLAGLLVVGPWALPSRADDPAAKGPTAVVRVKSLDGLIGDLKYIAKLTGVDDQANQMEGFLRSMLGEKGSEGIDPTRPLGLYGSVSEDVASSGGVLLIPVRDEKTFLDFLERFNVQTKKADDGVYTVTLQAFPVPFPVYMRVSDKYACFTIRNQADLAKGSLKDPAKVLAGGRDAMVSAVIHLDQIPEGVKQLGVAFMDLGASQVQAQDIPNATKAQNALRVEAVKTGTRQLASVLKEGGKVEFFIDLDRKTNELVEELSLSGKPGSQLASAIASLGQGKSLSAGLASGPSAMSALVHVILPENLRKSLAPVVDELPQKAVEKEPDPGKRSVAERFLKALAPTLKAGELDAALVIRGPTQGQLYTIVVGVKVKEGEGIDGAVRDLVKIIPPRDRERIKLDADTAGSVKVHRVEAQASYNEDARKTVGDNPLYLAFRSDLFLAAVGPDGLKALQDAAAVQAKAGPIAQVEVAFGRLAPAMAALSKNLGDPNAMAFVQKAAKDAFGSGGSQDDQYRLTLEGGNTLRIRQTVKAPVLKFFAEVAPKAGKKPGG